VIAWLALAGCAESEPAPIGGQSGTEMPGGCRDPIRTPVVDPSVPTDNLGFPADAVVAALGGRWEGDLAPAADGEVALILDLALYSEHAVSVVYDGQDPTLCPAAYELPGVAVIGVGGALQADVPVALAASAIDLGSAWGSLEAALVGGTLEPAFDDEDWATVALTTNLSFDGGEGRADLSWTAESAAPPPPSSGTGSATVSAAVAVIGGADLLRP
jgi:hypothetical protein